MSEAAKKLYAEGGMGRYYTGIGAALFQGPIGELLSTNANRRRSQLIGRNSPFR